MVLPDSSCPLLLRLPDALTMFVRPDALRVSTTRVGVPSGAKTFAVASVCTGAGKSSGGVASVKSWVNHSSPSAVAVRSPPTVDAVGSYPVAPAGDGGEPQVRSGSLVARVDAGVGQDERRGGVVVRVQLGGLGRNGASLVRRVHVHGGGGLGAGRPRHGRGHR